MNSLETKISQKLHETFRRYNNLTNTEEKTIFGGRVLEKKIAETEIRAELLCELLEIDITEAYRKFNKSNNND